MSLRPVIKTVWAAIATLAGLASGGGNLHAIGFDAEPAPRLRLTEQTSAGTNTVDAGSVVTYEVTMSASNAIVTTTVTNVAPVADGWTVESVVTNGARRKATFRRGELRRLADYVPAIAGASSVVTNTASVSNVTYAASSLAYSVWTNVITRTAGKTTNDLDLFAPWNLTAPGWNTNCPWFGMRGASGLQFWRLTSTNGGTYLPYGGALVSPRHVLTCHHAGAGPGSVLFFLGTNGVLSSNVVLNYKNLVPDGQYWTCDAQVGLLASAVTNCEPMRVLPTNWLTYFRAANYSRATAADQKVSIPVLGQDQWKRLWPQQFYALNNGVAVADNKTLTNLTRYAAINGDSGTPIVLPLGNELVLVSCWLTANGANWQTGSTNWQPQLQAAMDYLSTNNGAPTYSLQPVSLTNFTAYP